MGRVCKLTSANMQTLFDQSWNDMFLAFYCALVSVDANSFVTNRGWTD